MAVPSDELGLPREVFMRKRRVCLPTIIALLSAAPWAQPVLAQPEVQIREWEVPWARALPRDPAVERAGRIWFVGQNADFVARFDAEEESFQRYDLAEGTGPHTVIVDERGAWYAGNRANHIGRVDPATGGIERFEGPAAGLDPHTMGFAPNGDLWLTAQWSNRIGRLDPKMGEYAVIEVPYERARPYGLQVDAEGRPWIALFGTNRLASVDGDGELRPVELPREAARPRRLALPGDGGIWYVDYAEGYLGRYDPAAGEFAEWPVPAGEGAQPYGMTADDAGHVWFVETGPRPNRLVGFDIETESFTAPEPIPSGAGTVRNMTYDPAADAIWFGTDANTLGRARLRR
jgi:virginiamycin B lyase